MCSIMMDDFDPPCGGRHERLTVTKSENFLLKLIPVRYSVSVLKRIMGMHLPSTFPVPFRDKKHNL